MKINPQALTFSLKPQVWVVFYWDQPFFSWLGFLVFYAEKEIRFRLVWLINGLQTKVERWKSIGSDRCRLRGTFKVGRGLLPCCFPSTCQR